MATQLDAEIRYFETHRDSLAKDFPGRFVVIRNDSLLGAFDDAQKAMAAGVTAFGMKPFLVRRTDHQSIDISIPALALGILRANTNL